LVNIREYKNGDEKGIIPLFNQIFDTNRQENYWHWQFMENPAEKPIIVVAEDDSKVVGQCTLLPSKMTVKGEEILGGQSIDTMVSNDYRRQGIYEKMAFTSYDMGIERGIKIRFGFPSKPALQGLLEKLGGTLITDIPLYLKIYRLDNFLASIIKLKFLSKILAIPGMLLVRLIYRETKINIKEKYEMKEIQNFNEDFDKLWDRIKIDSPIMSNRDSKFLNWRIKDHPNIQYKTFGAYKDGELKGYMILKVENRKVKGKFDIKLGSIVDMIAINEDVILGLYNKSKEYFKDVQTDLVVCWATDSMKYKDIFMKLGFFKTKSEIPFVVKDLIGNKELENLIIDEKNWYIMPIESDIY
jgi:hypothetical protein